MGSGKNGGDLLVNGHSQLADGLYTIIGGDLRFPILYGADVLNRRSSLQLRLASAYHICPCTHRSAVSLTYTASSNIAPLPQSDRTIELPMANAPATTSERAPCIPKFAAQVLRLLTTRCRNP